MDVKTNPLKLRSTFLFCCCSCLLLLQESDADLQTPLAVSCYQTYLLTIKFSNPKMSNSPMDLRLTLLSLDGGL